MVEEFYEVVVEHAVPHHRRNRSPAPTLELGHAAIVVRADWEGHRKVLEQGDALFAAARPASGHRANEPSAMDKALAAALKTAGDYKGRNIAVVICGRNIALDTFRKK